jgi:hypothetical protein
MGPLDVRATKTLFRVDGADLVDGSNQLFGRGCGKAPGQSCSVGEYLRPEAL